MYRSSSDVIGRSSEVSQFFMERNNREMHKAIFIKKKIGAGNILFVSVFLSLICFLSCKDTNLIGTHWMLVSHKDPETGKTVYIPKDESYSIIFIDNYDIDGHDNCRSFQLHYNDLFAVTAYAYSPTACRKAGFSFSIIGPLLSVKHINIKKSNLYIFYSDSISGNAGMLRFVKKGN
jgi:hypothetical protein